LFFSCSSTKNLSQDTTDYYIEVTNPIEVIEVESDVVYYDNYSRRIITFHTGFYSPYWYNWNNRYSWNYYPYYNMYPYYHYPYFGYNYNNNIYWYDNNYTNNYYYGHRNQLSNNSKSKYNKTTPVKQETKNRHSYKKPTQTRHIQQRTNTVYKKPSVYKKPIRETNIDYKQPTQKRIYNQPVKRKNTYKKPTQQRSSYQQRNTYKPTMQRSSYKQPTRTSRPSTNSPARSSSGGRR